MKPARIEGEPVIVKRVNSAFIGTDLEMQLRAADIKTLVICGATTNHCVETTARMAGNLGFDARLVRDATWTFDPVGPDGDAHSAGKSQWRVRPHRVGVRGDRGAEIRMTASRRIYVRDASTIV
jgi:nicotinamidase-related amidase